MITVRLGKRAVRRIYLLAAIIALIAPPSLARADSAYTLLWNPVQGPTGWIGSLQECAETSWCKTAMEIGLHHAGFPSGARTVFKFLSASKNGGKYSGGFVPPSGERICRTAVTLIGARRATLKVHERDNRVAFYSMIPTHKGPDMPPWVGAIVTVHTVPHGDFESRDCVRGEVLHDKDYGV